jgi:hypothetical protein
LTRTQVGEIVGVSEPRIRQLEEQGKLHATIDERGVHRFDKKEVRAYAVKRAARIAERGSPGVQRSDGRAVIAAEVFQLFKQGVELPDIVILLSISPTLVRELYSEYTLPLGASGIRKSQAQHRAEAVVARRIDELDDEESSRRGRR